MSFVPFETEAMATAALQKAKGGVTLEIKNPKSALEEYLGIPMRSVESE